MDTAVCTVHLQRMQCLWFPFQAKNQPICNQKNSITLLAYKSAPAFLSGDSMPCCSKLSLHSLVEAFIIISHDISHCICSMFWYADVCMSRSSLFHGTHFLILQAPMHEHNTHCTWAVSPLQGIQALFTGKQMSLTATFFHCTLHILHTSSHTKQTVCSQLSPVYTKKSIELQCHSLAYDLCCIYHVSWFVIQSTGSESCLQWCI